MNAPSSSITESNSSDTIDSSQSENTSQDGSSLQDDNTSSEGNTSQDDSTSQDNNTAQEESSSANDTVNSEAVEITADELIEMEIKGAFDYFWNETQTELGSEGYGLSRDGNTGDLDFSSIASTGFALSAYAIGVEKGYISLEEGQERSLNTLITFRDKLESVDGFYYHFYHLSTGEKYDVEVSTIDTALFLCGATVAAEYFQGDVKATYEDIYKKVKWDQIVKSNNRFYMAYQPGDDGNMKKVGEWDVAAEQFMMYILGAGSPTYPVSGDLFYGFQRWKATYGDFTFIRSWANSLFAYQFSHAYVDFRGKTDKKGINWFENSIQATLASRQYSIDHKDISKTYHENSWGLSACLGKKGYNGLYGAEPNGMPQGEPLGANDGTIALYGAIASMPFTPEYSKEAMLHYYTNYPDTWGPYGFYESYNLDQGKKGHITKCYLGIDKGITLVQLVNYQSGFIWDQFMKNEYVQKGMEACAIQ
ncbi:MAG: hypothetical protein K0S47_2048 [Herbinix sp.]|nr:hypothetical protein [Herbinix sp.]